MRHVNAAAVFGALLTIGSLAPEPTEAKDTAKRIGESEIAQAKAAAKDGNVGHAGEILGGLVVTAVRMKSVDAEQRATEALEAILDGVEPDASADARGDAVADSWPGRAKGREVAAAVMKPLDPKRHGLFVSAHALAISIVLDAAALGDDVHLADAATVLATYAATPKAGAAATRFARFAEAIRLARAGDAAKAIPALDDAAGYGAPYMLVPSLFAYLELAILHSKAGDATKASEAISAACNLLPKDADAVPIQDWMHAVVTRWKDAPKPAMLAFHLGTDRFLGASAGTSGGRGGNGGGEDSPIGRAYPKWSASKPFATAKRGKAGFEILLPFDAKAAEAKEPIGRGARAWDASGVTLLLAGPAVALRMIDIPGTMGQPSERLRASRAWAYYWLADGETWGATKDGVVVSGP